MKTPTSLAESHFRETEQLLRYLPAKRAAHWLLNSGYFPESNILPPSFVVSDFKLKKVPYQGRIDKLKRRDLETIHYPKTALTNRDFGIFHPHNYHDIVLLLKENWKIVLDHLFHPDLRIYSYSLPFPVTKRDPSSLTRLRQGRLIYEWIEMAEKDLVQDSVAYSVLARVDIAQFYPSIYTHTIGWALHGRKESLEDKECKNLGSRIDRLVQYANDQRTNGIPIGSAVSDVIAEIILSDVDRKVSIALSDLDFVAVRFKDDYRFLCKSDADAERIIRELSKTLGGNNLGLNESKTSVTNLPDGLFRAHDRAYFPASLREFNSVSFKRFQHTLLTALDIHRKYPGTSLLEKFLSEIIGEDKKLKLKFSINQSRRKKEVHQIIALLFLLKRESEKVLSQVLAIIELLFHEYRHEQDDLKGHLKVAVTEELKWASERASVFEVVWLIFFCRLLSLGVSDFSSIVTNQKVKENAFYKSIILSRQELFKESEVNLFSKPKETREESLAQRLDIFRRD